MTHVRLTRRHTHAGKAYAPGERVEVDAATAAWLVNHDIATPESKPDPAPESESPEEPQP